MKRDPVHSSTVQVSGHVWRVDCLKTLLAELANLEKVAERSNSLLLFRGHREKRWLLDSTFMRSFKTTLFGIEPCERLSKRITESVELHRSLLNLFLLKFGVLSRPSDELEEEAKAKDLDPWFEFLKRTQQYPEEQGHFLPGTNLIDWSLSADVGLFFANDGRSTDGALFICDATATGNTHQKVPFGEILDLMDQKGNGLEALGVPLLVQPGRHIANPRPANQQAVYFAQIDLRYDLEWIWRYYEKDAVEKVVLKIELPETTVEEIDRYLKQKGIDSDFIYPSTVAGDA